MTAFEGDARTIRAELARRIEAVDRHCDSLRTGEIADELETIRKAAAANGIRSAVVVIHAIDTILSRGERGSRVHTGLAILRDAVACDRDDAPACDTFAAACSLRLG